MNASLLAGLLLSASSPVRATPVPAPLIELARERIEFAQLAFRSRVIIRIETTRVQMIPRWSEKKGPRCVSTKDIQASAVIMPNTVDLVLRGGGRIRVRFERSCPGLDYYSGFYLVPHQDGQICADRDVVRDRAGRECAIDRFRKLVPAK